MVVVRSRSWHNLDYVHSTRATALSRIGSQDSNGDSWFRSCAQTGCRKYKGRDRCWRGDGDSNGAVLLRGDIGGPTSSTRMADEGMGG